MTGTQNACQPLPDKPQKAVRSCGQNLRDLEDPRTSNEDALSTSASLYVVDSASTNANTRQSVSKSAILFGTRRGMNTSALSAIA